MGPPSAGSTGGSPLDIEVLHELETYLGRLDEVERAVVSDEGGRLALTVELGVRYYPEVIEEVSLTIRWYVNDDFTIHSREEHTDRIRECRWDRHGNPHNTRDHFHPPPDAPTIADNASWPDDYRDVTAIVLEEMRSRQSELWEA